jgi:hypothetical protein
LLGRTGSGRSGGTGGTVLTVAGITTMQVESLDSSTSLICSLVHDTKAASPIGGRILALCKGCLLETDQGVGACTDVGTTQFRLSDGTLVTNTGSIARGYKAGYGINGNCWCSCR